MTNLQSLDSIGPVQETAEAKGEAKNPVVREFEGGKRFLSNGDFAQAAIAFHNVLLAYEEKNDQNGIANASNQLGHVCLARKEYEQAEKHYQRALEICVKADDPMSQQAISIKLIEVYTGMKDYRRAIDTCLDLIEDYRLNNNPQGAVSTLEKMAEIYLESGDRKAAGDTYRTAAGIHRNFRHSKLADELEKKAEEL
ncbi:MAG: hypothetical protein CSB24_06565 [Deltaproteobacteria bacterium]|nr:MAG: hypothetical protein CSB24_06565 [Deltaproteobacteria bacterium]